MIRNKLILFYITINCRPCSTGQPGHVCVSLTSPIQMLYELVISNKLAPVVLKHCSVTVEDGVHMFHF